MNVIAVLISIAIFLIINVVTSKIEAITQTNILYMNEETINSENKVENIVQKNNPLKETIKEEQTPSPQNNQIKKEIWQIEIPSINLLANIAEGTTKEIMDQYVGHFENTSKWNGNVGLIAHNRGYPVNYFGRIKELNIGDEIQYSFENMVRIYTVDNIIKIKETDWSYLEETKENKITLITCVENEPQYRRCIQGIEEI